MAASRKAPRVCPQGHRFAKSADCPVCPVCERERAPSAEFMSALAAPARRALEGAGLLALKDLASRREEEVLALHGMGPNALARLRSALAAAGLRFRSRGPEPAGNPGRAVRKDPAPARTQGRTAGRTGKVNAAWHRAHRMPPNAGLPERAAWHAAHARACGCREMPAAVAAYLKNR